MLAGIQFVPKEKRAAVEDEREKKKARKDKKAHKREKERRRDARSDSDDDDAGGMLDADEMRRLAEAPASAPPPDLLSKASASASSSAPAPPPAPVQVTAAAAPSAPAAAPAAAPPISSNKEMAALLRARLKAPGILPAAPAPAPASASGSAPATQHQHQQQHQQQQPSNALAPDKRFLMAAKLSEKASGQALSALSAAQRLRVEARLEENMDEVYASNILRMGERYVGGELGGGGKHLARGGEDEEEGDVDVSMFTRQASEGAQQRQLAQQEQAARRAQQAQARCDLCAGSASHRAQLVVHTGALVALRLLPPHQQLVPLHCEIFPCAHFPSMLQAGAAEDGLEAEVAALKACLVKVFESLGQAVVFCEAAVGFSRGPHARVAVVPVPRGSQGEAQMMFREAMQVRGAAVTTRIDLLSDVPMQLALSFF